MKMRLLGLLFTFFITQSCLSQEFPKPVLEAMENKDLATVVIYRPEFYQGAVANWGVFDNQEFICKLRNDRYIIYQREAGDADIRMKVGAIKKWPKNDPPYILPLKAGETYFLTMSLRLGLVSTRIDILQVVERQARKDLQSLLQDDCNLGDSK